MGSPGIEPGTSSVTEMSKRHFINTRRNENGNLCFLELDSLPLAYDPVIFYLKTYHSIRLYFILNFENVYRIVMYAIQ